MHNFPPHLSYVATLPVTTLASEDGTLFSCQLVVLNRSYDDFHQLTTDELQFSLKFQALTRVSVIHLLTEHESPAR